jgi:iron(III) transport system ATP-binding protein
MLEAAVRDAGTVDAAPAVVAGLLVEGLSHSFGTRKVVDDVRLAIPPGEVHCLVGPSGCGKTTTLRLVAGLEEIQAGSVSLSGRALAEPGRSLPPERRRVGLMFQDFALFPHLSVAQNVGFGLASLRSREREARVARLLERVDMTRHARSYPHTLSGGEQQRVALARALAPGPELMLLDEAFSALDTELRAAVREETLAVLREAGTPALLVTHDAEEAIRVGDRIYAMQRGRIVQAGAPAELYGRPANSFVAGFFGPVNRFPGRVQGGLVRTPVGWASAPELGDGADVETIVRPEGIRVRRAPFGGGLRARVEVRRDLGPIQVLRLALPDGNRVRVRQIGEAGVEAGDEVEIELDPRHLFVYPAAG